MFQKCLTFLPSNPLPFSSHPPDPIYSATLELLGGVQVGYNLSEKDGWSAKLPALESSLARATASGVTVKAFVLINPGNPTGQVLPKEDLIAICKFCAKNKLVLMADEVYQENVYAEGKTFVSCKVAAAAAGVLDEIELVSFHSTSKGLYGECGRRGGYMELHNIDEGVRGELYKLASSGLCSGLPGQVMTSLMVNEPKVGDFSYESHRKEKQAIYDSLKRRAELVVNGLNSIEGFSCQKAEGAMYCFPSVKLPTKAVEVSKHARLLLAEKCYIITETTCRPPSPPAENSYELFLSSQSIYFIYHSLPLPGGEGPRHVPRHSLCRVFA